MNLQKVSIHLQLTIQPILLDSKSNDRQAAGDTGKTAKRIGQPTAAVVRVHVLVDCLTGAPNLECDAFLAALEA